jgi:hypothetical protein
VGPTEWVISHWGSCPQKELRDPWTLEGGSHCRASLTSESLLGFLFCDMISHSWMHCGLMLLSPHQRLTNGPLKIPCLRYFASVMKNRLIEPWEMSENQTCNGWKWWSWKSYTHLKDGLAWVQVCIRRPLHYGSLPVLYTNVFFHLMWIWHTVGPLSVLLMDWLTNWKNEWTNEGLVVMAMWQTPLDVKLKDFGCVWGGILCCCCCLLNLGDMKYFQRKFSGNFKTKC